MSVADFDPEYVFNHHDATPEKLEHYERIHQSAKAFAQVLLDHVLEAAVAERVEEGELERHVRKMRRLYRGRRDALVSELERSLGARFTPHVPAGGMALWGRIQGGIDAEAWRERAAARGVVFMTARDFAFDGRSRPFARLGFAALDERELAQAARLLAEAWPERAPRRPVRRGRSNSRRGSG